MVQHKWKDSRGDDRLRNIRSRHRLSVNAEWLRWPILCKCSLTFAVMPADSPRLCLLAQIPLFAVMTSLVAMMEALSEQNDNLTLPIWGWCLGVLLRL
jgi:hypothetical protein